MYWAGLFILEEKRSYDKRVAELGRSEKNYKK